MKHAPTKLPPPPLAGVHRPAESMPGAEDHEPLFLRDLLLDFDDLKELLDRQLSRGRWLDAFLLAAGMNQVLEDHLHRDVAELDRAAKALTALPAGGPLAAAARAARAAGLAARALNPGERRLIAWQVELDRAVLALAAASQMADATGGADPGGSVRTVLQRAPRLPRDLRRAVVRLPTCFRSLDQKPADLQRLVEELVSRRLRLNRPVLVVGLRTSGSYLAPLYAHFLVEAGFADVESMTLRPGQRLLRHEVARLRRSASRDGIVLLTDDPPKTGSSLARTAKTLEAIGVARASIKVLLPLLGGAGQVPAVLGAYEAVVLPMQRWAVRGLLAPDRLRSSLRGLLKGRTIMVSDGGRHRPTEVGDVARVELLDLGPRSDLRAGSPVRRHVHALLRATLRDALDGRELQHLIYVKGLGLGYFGDHSPAVAQPLTPFLPELYGVREGLLFRAWLPESARISSGAAPPDLPRSIGDYVRARQHALPATEDKSLRTVGLNPIWQRIADMLGTGFGRQRALFRPALHAAARRLLEVDQPSVIDGSMALSQWFASPSAEVQHLLKVDYDERAFSNQDTVIDQLYSYDAVFDLAVAAADHELDLDPEDGDDRFEEKLIHAYEAGAPKQVQPERWLLYQLLHLSSHQRFLESLLAEITSGAIPDSGLETLDVSAVNAMKDRSARAAARIDQRYLARTLLEGVIRPSTGPLCAIDIDGVLETGWRGYSSAGPAGAAALRRLMRHGYRPVIASGRSVGEVIDRCRAFGLAGGIAEYGAAVYDNYTDRVVELLNESEVAGLERIRARLRNMPGVHVDSGYRRIVRASVLTGDSRRPLPHQLVEELWDEEPINAIHGLAQTDIFPARVDKGGGVRALAALLTQGRGGGGSALAFAMGDSFADLSMLDEAGARFGPSNSDQAVRASGARITAGSRQAGLAEAVSLFLDHAPDRCPACRQPELSRDATLLLTALSAGGAGRWKKLGLGLRLAMRARN